MQSPKKKIGSPPKRTPYQVEQMRNNKATSSAKIRKTSRIHSASELVNNTFYCIFAVYT